MTRVKCSGAAGWWCWWKLSWGQQGPLLRWGSVRHRAGTAVGVKAKDLDILATRISRSSCPDVNNRLI